MARPTLTQARAPLVRTLTAHDAQGRAQTVHVPAERALTVYVDKHELVTLMTLGAYPEWLVLGYLLNQGLVQRVEDVHSVSVDWDAGEAGAGVAAVRLHTPRTDWALSRTVTTGCGQGSQFGDWMQGLDALQLPQATVQAEHIPQRLAQARAQQTLYRQSGSVHACALFQGDTLGLLVEDVGRHNALDTLAGWMAWHGQVTNAQSLLYTTGRLTSEMILKAARMGVAVVVSRSGMTEMGLQLAERLGVCAIGRARHEHFLVYTAAHRVQWATRDDTTVAPLSATPDLP